MNQVAVFDRSAGAIENCREWLWANILLPELF
jgi:hypothetical protein